MRRGEGRISPTLSAKANAQIATPQSIKNKTNRNPREKKDKTAQKKNHNQKIKGRWWWTRMERETPVEKKRKGRPRGER